MPGSRKGKKKFEENKRIPKTCFSLFNIKVLDKGSLNLKHLDIDELKRKKKKETKKKGGIKLSRNRLTKSDPM